MSVVSKYLITVPTNPKRVISLSGVLLLDHLKVQYLLYFYRVGIVNLEILNLTDIVAVFIFYLLDYIKLDFKVTIYCYDRPRAVFLCFK